MYSHHSTEKIANNKYIFFDPKNSISSLAMKPIYSLILLMNKFAYRGKVESLKQHRQSQHQQNEVMPLVLPHYGYFDVSMQKLKDIPNQ